MHSEVADYLVTGPVIISRISMNTIDIICKCVHNISLKSFPLQHGHLNPFASSKSPKLLREKEAHFLLINSGLRNQNQPHPIQKSLIIFSMLITMDEVQLKAKMLLKVKSSNNIISFEMPLQSQTLPCRHAEQNKANVCQPKHSWLSKQS